MLLTETSKFQFITHHGHLQINLNRKRKYIQSPPRTDFCNEANECGTIIFFPFFTVHESILTDMVALLLPSTKFHDDHGGENRRHKKFLI